MITDEAKRVKAEAYAMHIRSLVRRKHAREEEIQHQREELGLTGVALGERVSTSPSMDAIPDGVAKLLDMIKRYMTELAECVDEIDRFDKRLAQLAPQQHLVLYLHYVTLRKWPEVARKVNYSEPRIYEIRRDALLALYDVMPDYWRTGAIPDAEP